MVCLVDKNIDDNVLSNIAKETGVLETAFVEEIGESEYNLDGFIQMVVKRHLLVMPL